MELYHGSTQKVRKPSLKPGRESTDFGKGFYTTMLRAQAESWALNKQKDKVDASPHAVLNSYGVSDGLLLRTDLRIKMFDAPSEEWLLFVVACRRGKRHDYDIVSDPVANDKIYTTIMLFENQVISAEETIERLKIKEYYNQVSFHTPKAIAELKFLRAELLG